MTTNKLIKSLTTCTNNSDLDELQDLFDGVILKIERFPEQVEVKRKEKPIVKCPKDCPIRAEDGCEGCVIVE